MASDLKEDGSVDDMLNGGSRLEPVDDEYISHEDGGSSEDTPAEDDEEEEAENEEDGDDNLDAEEGSN